MNRDPRLHCADCGAEMGWPCSNVSHMQHRPGCKTHTQQLAAMYNAYQPSAKYPEEIVEPEIPGTLERFLKWWRALW